MTAEHGAVTEASAVTRDTRIDAITAVEACYALERSAEPSLEQLARLARASLGGFAAFAVAFELRAGVLRPGASAPPAAATRGGARSSRRSSAARPTCRRGCSDSPA